MDMREKYDTPLAGHTVTTHPDNTPGERTVGHVLGRLDEDTVEVLWLSTSRGAFYLRRGHQ